MIVLDTHAWIWWLGDGSGKQGWRDAIAQLAVELPEHHRDPQDRIIIATAIVNDAQLISADSRFPDYEELKGRLLS